MRRASRLETRAPWQRPVMGFGPPACQAHQPASRQRTLAAGRCGVHCEDACHRYAGPWVVAVWRTAVPLRCARWRGNRSRGAWLAKDSERIVIESSHADYLQLKNRAEKFHGHWVVVTQELNPRLCWPEPTVPTPRLPTTSAVERARCLSREIRDIAQGSAPAYALLHGRRLLCKPFWLHGGATVLPRDSSCYK